MINHIHFLFTFAVICIKAFLDLYTFNITIKRQTEKLVIFHLLIF